VNTPVEVVKAAFEAMNIEDWKTLGELCDQVALRVFKKELLEKATNTFRVLSVDIDDLIEADEDFDGPCKYAGAIDPGECLRSELYNVSTIEELQAMDPAKVFARWVQGKYHRQYRGRHFKSEEWKAEGEPKLSYSFSFVVLGSVTDSDGIAHVIYRNDRNVPPVPLKGTSDADDSQPLDEDELNRILCVRAYPLSVICRQQSDGSWRLVPTDSLYLVPTLQLADFG